MRASLAFLPDRRGGVAVVFALTMPLVIGAAGYGVETLYWHYTKLRIQQSADAAAYAAAIEQRAGSTSDVINAAATSAAQDNGYTSATDSLVVHAPPTSGAFTTGNAVEVIVSRSVPRIFSALFLTGSVSIQARSVSAYSTGTGACVLALDPTASRAAQFSGSAVAVFNGCVVMSNSNAADSVYVQGSATLRVPCVMSSGGVNFNSGVTLTSCTAAVTALPPVADPFRNVVAPTPSGNCRNDNGATLQPGLYCNGMTLSGNTNLNPGVYYIQGGTLKVNANANVTGTGVTFYLDGNATVSMNGNATVNISAPTSGNLSGILFFGSRSNTSGSNTFNGTASSLMTGAIYFPSQEVDYLGNFSGVNGCTAVVAKVVQWTGNTSINVNCSAAGIPTLAVGGIVKLAE